MSGHGAEDASDSCDGCARVVCVCDRPISEDVIDDEISETAARGTAFMRVTFLPVRAS